MLKSWIHTVGSSEGEQAFFKHIEPHINCIFDVGCREDSEFLDFKGEVHYFDPVAQFVSSLKQQSSSNTKAFYNCFGLGSEQTIAYYYPTYQSFHNRIRSCQKDDTPNRLLFELKRGDGYMKEKDISQIDFLKIDTEGHELEVLKGFGDRLSDVQIIQFEYGGTYLDSKIHLKDVLDYLEHYGFTKFAKLTPEGLLPLPTREDDYAYANIVCVQKSSVYQPY